MGEPDTEAEEPDHHQPPRDRRSGSSPAAVRMQHQAAWVDQQIRVAMAKGEFDDLPGQGKPIRNLGAEHDPDWWVRQLVEREKITGVLPPSLQLRKEDAELDGRLDEMSAESDVRRELEDFNERVLKARYSLEQGPPLVTMPRDVEETVAAWKERRAARRARLAEAARREPDRPERRWWRRRR